MVALARAARAARRVRRRARRRRPGRRRHPRAAADDRRSTPATPGRGRRRALHRRARSSSCSTRSAATSTPTGEPARRHPAVRGAPTSPTRPTWSRRSSGSPATTTSRRCCRPRRPGRGLTDVQRRRRSIGRALAEAGYVEAPSYPFVGTAALDALGPARRRPAPRGRRRPQPAVGGGAGAADDAAARPARDAGPQPLPRPARPGAVRARRGVPGRRAHAGAAARASTAARTTTTLAALLGAVPEQPWHVAVALAGNREPRGWWGPGRPATWADAVEAARRVAAASGVELTVRAGERAPWHPGRCAELLVGDRVVGHAGELHPRVCAALELPARTSVMELDVDALPRGRGAGRAADLGVPAGAARPRAGGGRRRARRPTVAAALREGAGELLEDAAALRRLHRARPCRPGQRSLAYALTLRAPDRTLTSEEAARRARRGASAGGARQADWGRAARGPDLTRAGRAGHRGVDRDRPAPRRRGWPRAGWPWPGWPAARTGCGRRWPRSRRPPARARWRWPPTSPTARPSTPPSRRVAEELGPVDLLVNNAGLIDEFEVPLWEADPDQWWDVVASHVRGGYLLCRSVVPVDGAAQPRPRGEPRQRAWAPRGAAGVLRLLGGQDRADADHRGARRRARGHRRAGLRPRPGRRRDRR